MTEREREREREGGGGGQQIFNLPTKTDISEKMGRGPG